VEWAVDCDGVAANAARSGSSRSRMHLIHALSRGFGILVWMITLAFSFAANLICNYLADDYSQYWNEHAWPFCYSLLASGTLCWHIGMACERSLKRQAADPRFHPKIDVPKHNDLFRIPVKWWGLILIAIALTCLIGGFAPGRF
jgi:hypothetical protein